MTKHIHREFVAVPADVLRDLLCNTGQLITELKDDRQRDVIHRQIAELFSFAGSGIEDEPAPEVFADSKEHPAQAESVN